MEIMLPAVITAIIYLLGDLICLHFAPLKERILGDADSIALIKRSLAVGFTNVAAVVVCCFYTILFTTVVNGISPVSCVVVSVFCYCGFVISHFLSEKSMAKLLKICALLCVIPFLLEIFVFNAKSFDNQKLQYTTQLTDFELQTPDSSIINTDGSITLNDNGSIKINIYKKGFNAVNIEFSGEHDNIFTCSALMTDENFSLTEIQIGSKRTSSAYGHCNFTFSPYGQLNTLKLSFTEVKSPVNIKSVTFLSAPPFDFSNLRFFLISAVGIIIYLICRLKLYKVVFDRRKKLHKAIIAVALLMCVLSTIMFIIPNEEAISYPGANISTSDHYVQMFDSICKGQAHLDIEPDPALAAIENPYDSSLRRANDISVQWDRAYYNGHYYSYFGIVPVLTFYFPHYFITGKLPTMNTTALFFSILAIIFMFGAVLTAVKKFVKKPNFMLLIIGLLTASFTSGILYCLDFSNIYFTALVAALAFLLLCLWTGMAAYKQKSAKLQILLLFLSGISFILSVGCRPTLAISALILAPVFISILACREYSAKRKICCVCSFLTPIFVGAAALMWYNYIRFGSILEFGTAYQLTVSDIRANNISLFALPSAIIQYFLQPLGFTAQFPHIELSSIGLANRGRYVYCDKPLSLIAFPSIILALFVLPLVLNNLRKRVRTLKSDNRVKFFTYLLTVILSVIIIWLDFCMAGAACRYLIDILPILTIMSILVFLECNSNFATTPSLQHKGTLIFSASMVLTAVMVFLQMLTFTVQTLFEHFPNILFETERLVEFWC